MRRASSTCATGLRLPACAQMEAKAYSGERPLSGRLKSSQSRSWPRPPRLDRKSESVLGRAALVGAVEEFPIAKLAASTEADAAGGDTAEGHGQHGKLAARVDR